MTSFDSESLAAALRRCESEPIQHINRIQPHGALVVVDDSPERLILQASVNLHEFFGIIAEQALGQPLSNIINSDQVEAIDAELASLDQVAHGALLVYAVADDTLMELQASFYRAANVLILEFEPTQTRLDKLGTLFQHVRKGLLALDTTDDIEAYCQGTTEFVRTLTGFDRVMVYRFDANWEGEVIAESRHPSVASYLGNRFPAGDIPPQARALYTRNTLRIVSDIEQDSVPIVPASNPQTGQPLDLTHSILRAFSPVHVEYLRNMQVRASASISIMREGKLWGLVACHHNSALYLMHAVRDMMEFVGRILSMKLTALEASSHLLQGKRLGKTTLAVLKHLFAANFHSETLQQHAAAILQLTDASGAVLIFRGQRYSLGTTPDPADLDLLLDWLTRQPAGPAFATSHLAGHLPAAERFAHTAAGCLATPVSPEMANAMIWFRPEKLRTIHWAGSPEKTLQTDELGRLRISPRKSFAAWTETWRHRCSDWNDEEVTSGATFVEVLIDVMLQNAADPHART